jgi:LysR family glycine cleavage system transcriptional activator
MHRVDFAREDVDLAIRHGDGQWSELDAVNLSAEELFPVCSPALLTSRGGLQEPEDVLKFPLLHLDNRRDWSRWLVAAEHSGEGQLHGPILNHASMLIDAAIDGQGIALARTMLAASDLIAGRLVQPFEAALPLRNTYWIVCPKTTRALPKIVAPRLAARGSYSRPAAPRGNRDRSSRDYGSACWRAARAIAAVTSCPASSGPTQRATRTHLPFSRSL